MLKQFTDTRFFIRWLSIGLMFTGFCVSRALLSIGLIGFISNELLQPGFGGRLKNLIGDKYLLLFSLLFLVPFITFSWSHDKTEWFNRCQDKFPLLFIALLVALPAAKKRNELSLAGIAFVLIIFAGTCWSFIQYINNAAFFHRAYERAKLFPTPASGDYIRFSWAVCVAFIVLLQLLRNNFLKKHIFKTLAVVLLCWFALYLHVLGSKTGIVGLYLIVIFYTISSLFIKKQKRSAILLLVFLIAAPFIAYKTIPTFRLRVNYVLWDYKHYSQGEYIEGLSDGNRIRSMKAGWSVFKNNFVAGTGYGDIFDLTRNWYAKNAPGLKKEEQLYPSNQWLMYGCGAGLAAVILFTIAVFYPFFKRYQSPGFYMFHALAVFTFIYENGLETQYGVFLYGFFTWYFIELKRNN